MVITGHTLITLIVDVDPVVCFVIINQLSREDAYCFYMASVW